MSSRRRDLCQVIHKVAYDDLTQSSALMARMDGDVIQLKSQSTVSYDPAHTHKLTFVPDAHGEKCVRQTKHSASRTFLRHTCKHTQAAVFVRRWCLEEQFVGFGEHLTPV